MSLFFTVCIVEIACIYLKSGWLHTSDWNEAVCIVCINSKELKYLYFSRYGIGTAAIFISYLIVPIADHYISLSLEIWFYDSFILTIRV